MFPSAPRRTAFLAAAALLLIGTPRIDATVAERLQSGDAAPRFELVQPELFGVANTFTNAIADYDNDADLDMFVGFGEGPNRLYRNDDGRFVDVAVEAGVAENEVTRAAAWGDYDGDGHLDLFVGFVSRQGSSNRLFRNEGDGRHFTDVTEAAGVGISGSFRQVSWVDYDNDGDVDRERRAASRAGDRQPL